MTISWWFLLAGIDWAQPGGDRTVEIVVTPALTDNEQLAAEVFVAAPPRRTVKIRQPQCAKCNAKNSDKNSHCWKCGKKLLK